MYIYKTTNLINQKIYIGQHTKSKDDSYLGSGLLILRAIKKYGKQNFKKEIIKECFSIQELNELEFFYIKRYNSIFPNGYNLRSGGNNSLLSEEIKEKISKSRKGKCLGKNNPNWKAKSFTNETLTKISKSVKNQYEKNPAYRKAISNTSKNRKHTKQTKLIISLKNSGKNNGRFLNFSDEIIKSIINDYSYMSMNKLSLKFKVSPQTIKRILLENNAKIINYKN